MFQKSGATVRNPVYVVGDIHGQTGFLEQALDWIAADGGADAHVIFLGDLVDRGPDSRGVVNRLMTAQADGRRWLIVKGNHDRLFTRFLSRGVVDDARITSKITWMNPRLGGAATLASYGVADALSRPLAEVLEEARARVPAEHRAFLEGLPLYAEHDGLLCVHAGIRPGVPLDEQVEDDLIWIRDTFLRDTRAHPWLVVHGHTAIDVPVHYGNRVNLDGGAGYGRPVYPAVFDGTDCWLLGDGGRVPLVP